ncbi:hypothetical protein C8N35_101388 [Breoghania corrubedonensis]|uniref:Uncharacterized protein n=1 Tax=Breoghania corrubedonensis TaxID=665038 RepID=A0A2T5VF18_9HYPH|nr:hypothetical protein [Breoghania corrubedonensis]PTW62347.1 hypothetical protein C8N35_101388 [Breoghania corrubedonensis]
MTERRETGPELDEDTIRSTLDRILSSETFSRSPKVSRLLGYLVERRLAGDEDGLKEARIAQDVFGQPDEFNPRSNPIVRVNASRLRNLLRQYYAGAGADDDRRILLPDVGYRPEFSDRKATRGRTPREERAQPARAEAAERDRPASRSAQKRAAKTGEDAVRQDVPQDSPAQAADAPLEADAAGPASKAPPAGMREAARRRVSAFGRSSVMMLVIANLVLASAFAILAGHTRADDVRHILALPAHAADAAYDTHTAPLFMLCDRPRRTDATPLNAYPVAIGAEKFVCWPVQLRQTDIDADPI